METSEAWPRWVLKFILFIFVFCYVFGVIGCAPRLQFRGPQLNLFTQDKRLLLKGACPPHSKSCTPLEPTDPIQYVDRQYSNYRQSGFINLNSNMRLRIVAPILRPGTTEVPTSTTGPASKDLLGHETAIYDLQPAKHQGLTVILDSIDIQAAGKTNGQQLPRVDYLKDISGEVYLRLYFQLRHSGGSHDIVLLQAPSQGKLNEASGAFEEAPEKFCVAPDPASTRCITFPEFTSVSAEIKVGVKKKAVYIPLGGTVADALAAYGVDDPKQVAHSLKITRFWQFRTVPVKFDRDSTAVLQFAVVGGDRITW
jgi:hypothetical protein